MQGYFHAMIQTMPIKNLIRDISFSENFEIFFVSAICAILGIRIYLEATHYPQIGGNGIHIAHMLWGGLFMIIAILAMLLFLNKSAKKFGAFVGGLGFGIFIDELGKFITSDNNYFFKPTFAIIYVIFVVLYLIFYELEKRQHFSQNDYLINSLELLKKAIVQKLDAQEKKQALQLLTKADKDNPITKLLAHMYEHTDTILPHKPGIFSRMRDYLRNMYIKLITKKWFIIFFNAFFILQFIVSLIVFSASAYIVYDLLFQHSAPIREITNNIPDMLNLAATTIAGIFIIIGVIKMKSSRLEAYKMFKVSLLICILFIQVFSFYQEQLAAFTDLLFNILILITLNALIHQEESMQQKS